MDDQWLAEQFEEHRAHLQAVAYRMLGSLSDAEDAVQESWLKMSRSGATGVENLRAFLTTVVARVCLNTLRSRKARREESLQGGEPDRASAQGHDPEYETQLADSVGLALLVVLEKLTPPERLALVLHDMFDLSFEEIAPIVGRTPAAARQLASRARRRVQGERSPPTADLNQHRAVVDAFLAAARAADFDALVRVLDPDVVIRVDASAARRGVAGVVQGAVAVARGALTFAGLARFAQAALVDGAPGIVFAPRGKLQRVVTFTVANGRILTIDVIADRERLRQVDLAVLPN